jgi:Ni,Fe-hydrogenase III small subunit/NAD-dependent dihydropyrimidine dehydrogenase PreA subunit
MFELLRTRWRQGTRTTGFPDAPPKLPERFRGLPRIDAAKCEVGCRACADACPTDAIALDPGGVRLDLGRCLFCTDCVEACPSGAIAFTGDYRVATRTREALVLGEGPLEVATAVDAKIRKLFGRSLKLRAVSAGGCNGCESDLAVLSTIVFDLGRFGIQLVASPRHADGLVVLGPVTKNMALALRKTWEAVPDPKLVIAVGACAISGGPFAGHPEQSDGAASLVPVDLFVPGCPPHPVSILDGMLRLLGRIESGERR